MKECFAFTHIIGLSSMLLTDKNRYNEKQHWWVSPSSPTSPTHFLCLRLGVWACRSRSRGGQRLLTMCRGEVPVSCGLWEDSNISFLIWPFTSIIILMLTFMWYLQSDLQRVRSCHRSLFRPKSLVSFKKQQFYLNFVCADLKKVMVHVRILL